MIVCIEKLDDTKILTKTDGKLLHDFFKALWY